MRSRRRMVGRAMVVAAVAASPLAALQADAAVTTGNATASGPGIAFQNTGGNVTFGVGHSESTVVTNTGGNASVAPLASPNALSTPSNAVDPGATARAHAQAIVDAARARALAQVAAARLEAEQAIERAQQEAEQARSQGESQSANAQAQANASSSASASSWSSH